MLLTPHGVYSTVYEVRVLTIIARALQIKAWWESNVNVWFPFMYSQKWNCCFQNRITMFCIPLPTLIYLYIHERFMYFQDRSAYSDTEKYVCGPIMNRSQTHNCGNWDGVIRRQLRKRSKMDARHTALVPKTNNVRQYRAGVYKLLINRYIIFYVPEYSADT
jgi:hypothetical protein